MWNERQPVEIFHLLFLRAFGARVGNTLYHPQGRPATHNISPSASRWANWQPARVCCLICAVRHGIDTVGGLRACLCGHM